MLSLERAKELLNDPTLSDEEIEKIRDGYYQLAEIIYEKWLEDRKEEKEKKVEVDKSKPKD